MPLDVQAPTIQEIGDYEIVSKIAEGGMGTVYKARRKTDRLIVAIKIIPAAAAKNQVTLSVLNASSRSPVSWTTRISSRRSNI